MNNLTKTIQALGLSDKAAAVYMAALELGEATVQQLAERAKLIRTTIYYTIEELTEFGALVKTERNHKTYYLPESPTTVLKRVRERMHEFEELVPTLEEKKHSAYTQSRMYFLYGVPGFKQIWDKIFAAKEKHYSIMTEGSNFLDFVKEKYIMEDIIKTKKKLGISSRQLIIDIPYARKIVAKDAQENRVSRLLPPTYRLPFTTIICKEFVAFISPRFENLLMVVESESFAKTQQTLFDMVWESATVRQKVEAV